MASRKGEFGGASSSARGDAPVAPKIGDPNMGRADFNRLSRRDQERHVAAITVLKPASEQAPKKDIIPGRGRATRPELPIHLQSIDDEGNSRTFSPEQKAQRDVILSQQSEFDKANTSKGAKQTFGGGRVAGQPREKTPAQKIREGIATKSSAARSYLLGSKEDESEPAVGSRKTKDLISHVRDLAEKVDTYHAELPGKVDAEAKYHEGEADKYGVHTPEGQEHSAHAGRLRAALGLHLKGLRETRNSSGAVITRPDMTSSNVVSATSRVRGAEKTAQGGGFSVPAPAVANVDASAAASKLHSTIRGIAKTPLGKLGFLPNIAKSDLDQLKATSEAVEKPSIDYTLADRNEHPVTGQPSKAGHVWIGTPGGLKPTIRQVPVHPDTLKEILSTPRNGRPRTKQDPDYMTVRDAIATAKKASGGSGTGVYKGADAAGLPVKMERVQTNVETTSTYGKGTTTRQTPTPVEDIPVERRVMGPDGKAIPGAALRPVRGGPNVNTLSPEERAKVQENRKRILGYIAPHKKVD
jgi:hypothetical protein